MNDTTKTPAQPLDMTALDIQKTTGRLLVGLVSDECDMNRIVGKVTDEVKRIEHRKEARGNRQGVMLHALANVMWPRFSTYYGAELAMSETEYADRMPDYVRDFAISAKQVPPIMSSKQPRTDREVKILQTRDPYIVEGLNFQRRLNGEERARKKCQKALHGFLNSDPSANKTDEKPSLTTMKPPKLA